METNEAETGNTIESNVSTNKTKEVVAPGK